VTALAKDRRDLAHGRAHPYRTKTTVGLAEKIGTSPSYARWRSAELAQRALEDGESACDGLLTAALVRFPDMPRDRASAFVGLSIHGEIDLMGE
jgi:hypothetical protein